QLLLSDCVEREWVGSAPDGADEQVDATERLYGPICEQRDSRFAVHRPGDAHRTEPLGAERRFGRGDPVLMATVDHHRCSFAGEAEGTGAPDARIRRRAGDDGDPT